MAKPTVYRSIAEVSRLGGLARAAKLSKEQRSAAARKASKARWKKAAAKIAVVWLVCCARPVNAEPPRIGFQPLSTFTALNRFGDPIAGARLFVYDAGTSRPAISWSTPIIRGPRAIVNANPVIMDSRGMASVYLQPTKRYRLVLRGPYRDDLILREWDNVERLRRQSPLSNLAPYAAAIVGNAADLLTTRQSFSRGAVEINPLISGIGSSRTGITAIKLGLTAALLIEMRYLATHGHPTAAKWIGYVDGASMIGIAAHNRTVARSFTQ